MVEVSESSPLLVPDGSEDPSPDEKQSSSFPVLFELIGARNLPFSNMETYCVIQYGPRTIHRTKPFSPKVSRASRISQALFINRLFGGSEQELLEKSLRDPIWTIHEDSLLSLVVSPSDISNNKSLKITLWGRPRGGNTRNRRKGSDHQLESIGKIRIPAPILLDECTEQRMELQLMNELGQPISDDQREPTLLAYRCRLASKADMAFVDHWTQVPRPKHWRDTDIIQDPDLPRATLMTEIPEQDLMARAPALINPLPPPAGHERIKPYPDPQARPENCRFISREELKKQTILPSRKWIQAGSKASSIGRLYLEILSAHGLPNVDIGQVAGNETDAFCSVVYGDAMTQTDVIFDELNPHWPCWSQRAFVFHMQHPSQVLYLAVFGFKRSPLQHRAIGRVEVNPTHFHTHTVYNLEYDLFGSSHATQRQTQGKIRIRVRLEMDNERTALLAALKPPQPVYINTTKKKSMTVARYTACGEYDNHARFSIQVLQGYIDEILEGYLRRILYSIHDGTQSLIFWRDQVHLWGVGLPLYSFLAFAMGILIVERPHLFPAILCFLLAMIFLEQMQDRLSSPSPWRRCFSFGHYLRILVFGRSGVKGSKPIPANQGAQEQEAKEEAMRQRIQHDKEFVEKKEAVERQIEEIENFKVQNNSQPIPVELMIVLGKVQGIVGDVCRICRLVDSILTWEESDVAFWITLGLMLLGTVFIFVPWGFLVKWTGRILVIGLLGPQNKVLDLLWYQNLPTDDRRIYQLFAERMFEARCRQEEAGKLKSFRHILYGKYATWVPPLFWSPHQDFPLPLSTAFPDESKTPTVENLPLIPGQHLHGTLVYRPEEEWRRNNQESMEQKKAAAAAVKAAQKDLKGDPSKRYHKSSSMVSSPSAIKPSRRESSTMQMEEGLEITDLYDEEAGFVQKVFNGHSSPSAADQVVVDPEDLLARYDGKSIHDFDDDDAGSSDDEDSIIGPASPEPIRIPSEERGTDQQSMIELGFEMGNSIEKAEQAMKAFEALSSNDDAKPSETLAAGTKAASTTTSNSSSSPKKKKRLLRDEAWQVNSDLTGIQLPPKGDSRTDKDDSSEGATHNATSGVIQPSPTILNAQTEEGEEEEFGFEVVETFDDEYE